MSKKSLGKIILSLVSVGVIAVALFVGYNLYQSKDDKTVDQSPATTTEEVKSTIDTGGDDAKPSVSERVGKFSGLNDYVASGEARIETVDGKNVLKFSSDFQADNGPDLLVYLSENEVQSGGELDPFVSLGKLKSKSGEQIYSLPDDISKFKSVVIFCRAFNAPFGAADL